MSVVLGIDTSNYTTSVAVYDSDTDKVIQRKKLLPVKEGQLGLRQSDAVYHHTVQLPEIINDLYSGYDKTPDAIAVSVRPRNISGSYMPCFLAGKSIAESLGAVYKIPVYATSHQIGHIFAALYSSKKQHLINERFLAFHVSGGTTDLLYAEPDEHEIIKLTEIGTSLDLHAGQVIDRVGVMLGMQFPCGTELEKLAEKSDERYKLNPSIKENSCCLSGIENLCRDMYNKGSEFCDIANFCLSYIYCTIREMIKISLKTYGNLPIVFAGGVMSNLFLRSNLEMEFEAYFAEPQFSCDNAAGTAYFGFIKENG